MPLEFLIDNRLINAEFLGKRTGEATAGAYLLTVTEIIISCQQVESGTLLIFNNCVLGLLWKKQCFYLYDSYRKGENITVAGMTVLLKFESLSLLENYIRSVCYANYPIRLYFQIQLFRVSCTL